MAKRLFRKTASWLLLVAETFGAESDLGYRIFTMQRHLAIDVILNEPFGTLDEATREQLQGLVTDLQRDHGLAFLFVTHDVGEALYLGRSIYILRPDRSGALAEKYPIKGIQQALPEIKQSEGFFKELQALRGRFYRIGQLRQDPGKIKHIFGRGLIDESLLAEIERDVGKIWVISLQLRQDLDNPAIRDAVQSNLEAGKTYRYVMPEGDEVAAENRRRPLKLFAPHRHQIRFDVLPGGSDLGQSGKRLKEVRAIPGVFLRIPLIHDLRMYDRPVALRQVALGELSSDLYKGVTAKGILILASHLPWIDERDYRSKVWEDWWGACNHSVAPHGDDKAESCREKLQRERMSFLSLVHSLCPEFEPRPDGGRLVPVTEQHWRSGSRDSEAKNRVR